MKRLLLICLFLTSCRSPDVRLGGTTYYATAGLAIEFRCAHLEVWSQSMENHFQGWIGCGTRLLYLKQP